MSAERRTLESTLSRSNLTGPGDKYEYRPTAVMPDVKVVKIGGQSILDRGRAALFPILDEIVEARRTYGVQVVLLTGGGTRARHIYSIASELEVPTGVVATLGKYIPMQNARMLQMLLAKHGGLYILPDDFEKLPLYMQMGCIPIMSGMPPFGYWEKREEGSRIPPHRTDAGVFLSAEFLGSRRAIYIKDEDGLYTDDPKKNPAATHIPRITAKELQDKGLPDLVVERVVVEYVQRSQWCKELQILNGLVPGQVLAALRGEDVGTIITG
ncbi:MAG: uridine kinase [Deltaproteobacteria bacterium]|nr:uridine kinase [Deltaproteobacteria bacterium]MCW5803491.1 uridine kinase [Deltaproteobacteria bacterium]